MADNQLVMKTLLDIKEDVGGIKGDITILKEHHKEVSEVLTRIESKHNQDYIQYVQSREDLQKKVDPMWIDYTERQNCRKENIKGVKKILFSVSEKLALVIVGGMFAGGFIKKLLELFK